MSSPGVRAPRSPRVCNAFILIRILFIAETLLGVVPSANEPWPDVDHRPLNGIPSAAQMTGRARLARAQVLVGFDPLVATPVYVTCRDACLPLDGGGGAGASPLEVVGKFLDEQRALFGAGSELLETVRLQKDYRTDHNGLRTVIWQQELGGIPVWGARLVSNLTRDNRLVTISSLCLPQLPATGGGPVEPSRNATAALQLAAELFGKKLALPPTEQTPTGGWRTFSSTDLNGAAFLRLVWLPTAADTIRLCWEIILTPTPGGEMYRVVLDGENGRLWLRHCLTDHAAPATFRVFTSESPRPLSSGQAIPITNEPPEVARSLVTLVAMDTNASPHGWIFEDENFTRGNNVYAQLDRDNNDQPDTPLLEGNPERVFDFSLDLNMAPGTYGSASTVQLFYWNNWIHDRLYALGFTETAGNFQLNNFGRGGLGGDPVLADAQNGGDSDNATFSTPPDGLPPRMQMYLWSGPQPDRDASLDAQVVLHEYAHGLTHRLLGDMSFSSMQAQGLGEGWSDFYALALLSEESDDPAGNYALGAYLAQRPGAQNYYFGLRRYPYTIDLNKNPLTFRDIDPAQADAHDGIPRNPVPSAQANQIHNLGEVWCVILWEARARLIQRHGFKTGNELILQLVTDALRLTPANPTFVQARDAILIADRVLTGGQNENELWGAFAKRGLGFSARAPASHTTSGVHEAFDLPDTLIITPLEPQQATGDVGGAFVPKQFTYGISNSSMSVVVFSMGSDVPWLSISNQQSLEPLQSLELNAYITGAARLLPAGEYQAHLSFTNLSTGRVQVRNVLLSVGQTPVYAELFDLNANDLAFQSWMFTPTASGQGYTACRSVIQEFPSNPAGGTPLNLGEDNLADISPTNTQGVLFFGRRYRSFTASSNGYLTFGEIEQARNESIEAHFRRTRLSALFDDLDPSVGGQISWQELPDRVVVTYLDVPELFTVNTNSFQIELFFDGRLRLNYLQIDAIDGLVGLSPGGGIPAGFVPTDFTALPECARILTLQLPETMRESAAAQQGVISIPAPASSHVVVTLVSERPDRITVPTRAIIPAGEVRTTFNLRALDNSLFDGPQRVMIRARATGYSEGRDSLMVLDDEQAELQIQTPPQAIEGQRDRLGSVRLSRTPADYLLVLLDAEPPAAVKIPSFVILSPGHNALNFTFDISENNLIEPPRTAVFMARVPGGPFASAVTLVDDNESRQLALAVPANEREGSGELLAAGTILLGGILPTNLVVALQSTRPDKLHTPATVTIPAGQNSVNFPVTYPENDVLEGNQNVVVHASAPGFLAGSFSAVVSDNEIPLPPTVLAPLDQATNVPANVTLAWELFDVGEVEPTVFDLYFSTSPELGPATLVLTTNTTRWAPGLLQPLTTYYWQVVARRRASTAGPVWRFTTQGLDHFHFAPIATPQSPGQPFPVTITAQDAFGTRVTRFQGEVGLSATGSSSETSPLLLISEVETGDPDYAEFLNVSRLSINLAGWRVALYDQSTWPEPLVEFPLPNVFCPAGAAFRLGDLGQSPGSFPIFSPKENIRWLQTVTNNPIAVLLRDPQGNIADFFCAGSALPAEIANPVVIPRGQWQGDPLPVNLDTDINYQRRGSVDLNTGQDWVLATANAGVANPDLPLPFNERRMRAISPTNFVMIEGQWTGTVTFSEPAANALLVASSAQGQGTSSVFAVTLQNDLTLRMTNGPDPVAVGGELDFYLSVSNSGPTAISGVMLTNTLPQTMTLLSVEAPNSPNTAGQDLIFFLGDVAPFQTKTIHLRVQAEATGTVTNRASVRLADGERYVANNSTENVVSVRWPLLSVDDAALVEGHAGATVVHVPIRLSLPTRRAVQFRIQSTNLTARASEDYEAKSELLTLAPGQTNLTAGILIFGDRIFETNETFALQLLAPQHAQLARSVATITITNDEPVPALTIADTSIVEGRTGYTQALFSILLSPAQSQTVTVRYATESGSATAEQDFLPVSGSLQIPPGVTSTNVAVLVSGDRLTEGHEFFQLVLSRATNAQIAIARAKATILNDDGYPGQVDHLDWEISPAPHHAKFPFQATLTARDTFGQIVPSFHEPLQLFALREAPRTVRVLSFVRYTSTGANSSYAATLAAIRSFFTDFTSTVTTQVNPDLLRLALSEADVFLIPAQELVEIGVLGPLGTIWSALLNEFVERGGIVIVCSGSKDEHMLLTRAQLLQSDKFGSSQSLSADAPGAHPFLENVPLPFVPPLLGRYVNHNGTVLIQHNRFAAVLVRSRGAGQVLLIGTDFRNRRASLDQLLANAIRQPQIGQREALPMVPTNAGAFLAGRWSGSVTVGLPGFGIRLLATNQTGLYGISEPMTIALRDDISVAMQTSTDPTARNAPCTYTMIVSNTGPGAASTVILSNALPGNASPLSWTTTQGGCALKGEGLQCALGSIQAFGQVTVTVDILPPRLGMLTNTVTVFRGEPDSYSSNNTAQLITRVEEARVLTESISVIEGDAGISWARFPVRVFPPVQRAIEISYLTCALDGSTPEDFLGTNGIIRFAPGQMVQFVEVPVIGDEMPEANETFCLQLTQTTFGTLAMPSAIATILDDDVPAPRLQIHREGDQVILTWPAATQMTLQAAPQVNGPAEWSPVLATPGLEEGQNRLTLPVGDGTIYFRLAR